MRRARVLVSLALAVALAACGGRGELAVPEGVAAADPRLDLCRSDATAAPEVRAIAHRQPASTQGEAWDRWRAELAAARRRIFLDCLVREGAITATAGRPGSGVGFGVEAPGTTLPPRPLPEAPRPAPSGY